MNIKKKLFSYLDDRGIKYTTLDHKRVYTGYDLAQTLREQLGNIAKSIMIEADKKNIIVVLPSNRRVNVEKLAKKLKAKSVKIVKENAMVKKMMGKNGALTAFGTLYKDTPVLVDKTLTKAKKVVATTGDFESSLHMTVKEFLKATEGVIAQFSDAAKLKLQTKSKKSVKHALSKVKGSKVKKAVKSIKAKVVKSVKTAKKVAKKR